jgi:hypothetical protein
LAEAPVEAVVLAETQQGSVFARLELDENDDAKFIRADLDSGTREAVVNVEQLRGTQAFFVALVWSPAELRLRRHENLARPRELPAINQLGQRKPPPPSAAAR